jgi:DNA polymerase-1
MPEGGPKLLLVDGNNMCHRVYWTHQGLSYKGTATGVLYGFFRQLVHLHKNYPDHFRIVAWDGGYARRLDESVKAVAAGIVPSAYKENRKDKTPEEQEALDAVFEQMDQLRDMLKMVKCVQVHLKGFEADDIIYTYADYAAKWGGEAVVVSSDHDFYQVLKPGVKIYDAMKDETWSAERFSKEFGFSPSLWVDVGGIMGDKGDNIFGVEGWGPVTTYKYIREFGSMAAVAAAVAAKTKKNKKEQALADSWPRMLLARSLKQMDSVPELPRPRIMEPRDVKVLEQFFIDHGFVSLMKEAWRLV